MADLTQWQSALLTLGVAPANAGDDVYEKVLAGYNAPHRHYHTLQHLTECLEKLEELRLFAEYPGEVALALWFHDAVYDPRRSDNEAKSAAWAKGCALALKVNNDAVQRIVDLIMATRHSVEPVSFDEKIMLDVDLAIFAADAVRFGEYERQVREEYAFVPDALFKTKRREILLHFLQRPFIFHTPHFISCYEQRARSNLNHALEAL